MSKQRFRAIIFCAEFFDKEKQTYNTMLFDTLSTATAYVTTIIKQKQKEEDLELNVTHPNGIIYQLSTPDGKEKYTYSINSKKIISNDD